ncbi:MAG TPA: TadE/TadG family type IV pilus assembly protein [Candidatus Dormibacteraeota bacterium]|nr:TadE/TadG family type IV pilus assembly protein [Candidatus Dormibacteraeota bacterium]
MRGAAMVEFALAWPVALLLVLSSVELAVWVAESFAARSAALAGARAASVAGASPQVATGVTIRVLAPSLVGVRAVAWCPGQGGAPPPLWVCARDLGSAVQVDVGGSVPALVPLAWGGGLPLHAHVALQKETFAR